MNNIIKLFFNCNQHFGNLKPWQFPTAVWQNRFRIFYLKDIFIFWHWTSLIVVFCIVSCLYLCLCCYVSVSLPNFRWIKIYIKWPAHGTSTVPIVSAHFRSLLVIRVSASTIIFVLTGCDETNSVGARLVLNMHALKRGRLHWSWRTEVGISWVFTRHAFPLTRLIDVRAVLYSYATLSRAHSCLVI